jgi:hypothetical protein
MTIESVRQRFEAELLRLPNVVSVGIGAREGRPVIQVGVVETVPASRLRREEGVPDSLEGYEVEVVEVGRPTTEVKEGRGER